MILYHANCDDGFGAAWAAWRRFGDSQKYIPVQYGDDVPFPDMADDVVYMLDYSAPRAAIEELSASLGPERLAVLDHHKSAQEDLGDLPYCYFDMDRSGAVIAWEYWHKEPVPVLLQYVQDRDLWRKELPNSEEFTAMLRSYPRDFETWDLLNRDLEDDLTYAIRDGAAILQSQKVQIAAAVARSRFQMVLGHEVPVANETQYFSEVAGMLAERCPAHPFGAVYFDRSDGKRQWSLRSRGDFDVSEVARLGGGGGHRNAAGFTEELRELVQ